MWGILQAVTFHPGELHLRLVFTTCALILATTVLVFSTHFATAAGKVVYRWTDERGNQVNSDRPPPPGIKYETIATTSSMMHTVEPENSNSAPTANPKTGKEDPASPVADANAQASQKNPELCARAKDNLTQLDTHARIRLRDDQGEVRYLSEEEKSLEKQKAQDAIKVFCE
jgi:Domain of unknown function (DUF4124)